MTETRFLARFATIANAVFNSTTANSTAITAISVGGASINATAFPGTANNTNNLNGQAASFYTNATNITTGTLPTARLGTGTANSSTFLSGNQTWQIAGFPAGTSMLFVQTAAPTGWTKSITHDNKALRVVNGTASSGGSVAFTTAFASQAVSGTVGGTTLSTSQIPAHTHTAFAPVHDTDSALSQGWPAGDNHQAFRTSDRGRDRSVASAAISTVGGGGSHDHSFTGTAINLAVQYVDAIIATKD